MLKVLSKLKIFYVCHCEEPRFIGTTKQSHLGIDCRAPQMHSGLAMTRNWGQDDTSVSKNTESGFTLIEVLLYSVFLSLLIGSALGIMYQTIDNAGRINQKITIQQEGLFILAKIQWALTGASSITAVSIPPSLSVNKYNFASNPLVFSLSLGTLQLQRGAGTPVDLNSQNVTVSNLAVTDIPAVGKKPQGVTVSFNLSSGVFTNQPFSMTKYLRK